MKETLNSSLSYQVIKKEQQENSSLHHWEYKNLKV